jgi:hypothetical protein
MLARTMRAEVCLISGLPNGALVVRFSAVIVPTTRGRLQMGDRLLILADQSQRALLTGAVEV